MRCLNCSREVPRIFQCNSCGKVYCENCSGTSALGALFKPSSATSKNQKCPVCSSTSKKLIVDGVVIAEY